MKKIMCIISKIALVLLAILFGFLAISTIVNALITTSEKKQYPEPGMLVTVHDEKMHLYSKGTGDRKIVILSGFGTYCPVLDLKYLVDELSTQYTVIVVEYFGYGWSSRTNTPRTVSNIVAETSEALKLAGFTPPFILMPHSLSGIYALFYANTYPTEVEAVIGLDSSVPSQYPFFVDLKKQGTSIYGPSSQGSTYWDLMRISGISRIKLVLAPLAKKDTYSADDMALLKTMYLKNYGNPDLIDEADRILDNLLIVQNMKIPDNIPAAFILAENSVEINTTANGLDWVKMHEDLLPNNIYGKVIILPGEHYIYYTNIKEIKSIVDEVLNTANN